MEELLVIKIGGNVIDNTEARSLFLRQFAALPQQKILVHGGGKMATEFAEQLQIPQQLIDGRRVTDAATLKIITMVYAGFINKNIVAELQSYNCNAFGLSGADGNMITATRRAVGNIDYGFVGDIKTVDAILIKTLLANGLQPVVAPLTHDGNGSLLNTNADTIAQEIAQSMSNDYRVNLIYCFEKPGVLSDVNDPSSVVNQIDTTVFEQLLSDGKIKDGMLPKLHNAFSALNKGVCSVSIGSWENIAGLASGTSGTKIIL